MTPPRGLPACARRTARGGAVNAAFLSGAELLVLAQSLLATALLGPDLIGLYGVVTTTAMTIVALRRVGIDEAFVQTRGRRRGGRVPARADGRARARAARRARGRRARAGARRGLRRRPPARAHARRDLPAGGVRAAGAAVGVLQAHGVRAAADAAGDRAARDRRGHGAAAARRRRGLGARDRPVLRQPGGDPRRLARVAVPAAAAPRPRRGAPLPALLVAGVRHRARSRCWSRRARSRSSGSTTGLAAAGWITLAATLTRYADRADQILATTIYPAIVRVRDRADVLEELFAKANRLTLMWAFPFGAGLALFGADLIVFVLGDEWRGAIVLLGGHGGRGRAAAGRLQLVRVLPGARRVVAAGGRVGRVRRSPSPRSRSRARCSAARGASSPGGSAARPACSRSAASTCGGCCPACGWGRSRCGRRCRSRWPRRPSWRCGSRCGAGSGRSPQALIELALWLGGLAARDAPPRERPAHRAARLPARGRRGVRIALLWLAAAAHLRLHAAPLPRAARRGDPDAGGDADGRTASGRGATSAGPTGRASRWS